MRTVEKKDIGQLIELGNRFYEEIRGQIRDAGEIPIEKRQMALLAARNHSLFYLINELSDKGCTNELGILIRPLIEDALRIKWVCDSAAEGSLSERLFSLQFEGRLEAYYSVYQTKRPKKANLTSQSWWADFLKDVLPSAQSLKVKFALTKNPGDVIAIPSRAKIYEAQAAKGIDLHALEPVYVYACSATHRDGHDLNRYWIRHPDYPGEILVELPYDQPEHFPGERETLHFVSCITFLGAVGAIRGALGISNATDIELEALMKKLHNEYV